MNVCKHVYYSGRVQGVGFRYTAQGISGQYAVSGFVRNLSNGEVELWVEGKLENVDAFLAAIAERMRGYIEDTNIRDEAPVNCEGFQIRF